MVTAQPGLREPVAAFRASPGPMAKMVAPAAKVAPVATAVRCGVRPASVVRAALAWAPERAFPAHVRTVRDEE